MLRGGFLHGGLYVVHGPPGAGKTVFGNQFCFHSAAEGRRALYVTVLAENHARMVAHLEGLAFFRPEWVGDKVRYLSGLQGLKHGGLPLLLKTMGDEIRRQRASALVIDGLGCHGNEAQVREFLQGLSAQTLLAGCTTVMLEVTDPEGTRPEQALADGLITLENELIGLKAIRSLEVSKFRGGSQITGKHCFDITSDGFEVYPRTEALYSQQPTKDTDPSDRLAFGIPSFDQMMCGGLVRHSSTLLLGSPGSGKTVLGLHFLAEGARRGEHGLYFGFAETQAQLREKGRVLGVPVAELEAQGGITLEVHVPVESLPDALVQQLVETCEKKGVRRLFIDGLEPLAREAIDPERNARFITALLNQLRSLGVTTIATQQTNALVGPELHAPLKSAEAIVENIILLRFVELRSQIRKALSVLKMRESGNDSRLRELLIEPGSVRVGGPFEQSHALLTGLARPLGTGPLSKLRRAAKKGRTP